jgi:hypothetical protein
MHFVSFGANSSNTSDQRSKDTVSLEQSALPCENRKYYRLEDEGKASNEKY